MKKAGGGKVAAEAANRPGSAVDMQFWNCLKKGDVEGLQQILLRRVDDPEAGAVTHDVNHSVAHKLVNSPSAKRILPLSFAISQGMDEQGLHLLLRAGANVDGKDGTTEQAAALHTACWGEDDIATALLLRCGANPLITDAEGRTPLHVLASLNAGALFSYFLEMVTTKEVEQRGTLYLEGHPPVIVSADELLRKKDHAGFTVLHTAVSDISGGSDRVVSELLDYLEVMAEKDSANVENLVNIPTESGNTVLHILLSTANRDENIVVRALDRLLKLGANPIAVNECGYTPLTVTVMTHSGIMASRALWMLLSQITKEENMIEKLETAFLQRDSKEKYALIHHAIARRNIEAVKIMVDVIKFVEKSKQVVIKEWIGDPTAKDDMSVAQMVADGMCDEIANLLLTANAIDKESYENLKRERKEKEEKEKERIQSIKETSSSINETNDLDDDDDDSASRGNQVSKRNTGDFSGFGSTTMASGSRVQQARKARTQAAAQRRKNIQARSEVGATPSHHFGLDGIPRWVKAAVVFLVLSIILRVLGLLSGVKKGV